jgi:hypothetical protein
MSVEELVDAALVGFDRRELIAVSPLHQADQWEKFDSARRAMLPGYAQQHAAPRCRIGA